MTAVSVKFSELCGFTGKQWLATSVADTHRYMLFGGSRGPGKSYWLRWYVLRSLLVWAGRGKLGVRVMLACEDYPSLYERQASKIMAEFPASLGTFHLSRNEFRLHAHYGGGAIALRNLDDASKYQSAEYALIAIDEVTKNSERTFHLLRGSLRWPGIDDVRIVSASNPAANWVRDYWIEGRLPDEMAGREAEFAFVPALPEDNPHLPQSYWEMLDTLPGALRQAWRYGDWYAGVEGLVLDNFTAENMTDEEPDLSQPYELAIDDGYVDPRATLFIQRKQDGSVLVFDELYQTKTLEERTIADIKAAALRHGFAGMPELAAVSHEAVALRQRLRSADIAARNWMATKAGGGGSTRVQAVHALRALVCDGQGRRSVLVHRRCRNLLDEIMAGWKYPEGKRSINEHPADGNDHACDALSAWVWLRMGRGGQ